MSVRNKRLRVMAGPNGSGKSTILKAVRNQFYCGPFVNADEIEKSLKENRLVNLPADYGLAVTEEQFESYLNHDGRSWLAKAAAEHMLVSIKLNDGLMVVEERPSGYDAAIAADFIRHCLLNKGETFTFETVMSHTSKIEFLHKSRDAGFKNYLYFICTVDPAININRVNQRVALGGHAVEEAKIIKRYAESLEL